MRTILATLLACCLAATGAKSTPLTLRITGSVQDIWTNWGSEVPTPGGLIQMGNTISLDVTYDPTTLIPTGFDPFPGTQIYVGNVSYHLTVGKNSIVGSQNVDFLVYYNAHWSGDLDGFDEVLFDVSGPQAMSFYGDGQYGLGDFNFWLTDYTDSALSDYAFPNPIPFSSFSEKGIDLDFSGTQGTIFVRSDNLSFAQASAPEPSTWVMSILGAAMIGFALRRHRLNVAGGVAQP